MEEQKFPTGLGTIWLEDEQQPPITAYFTPPRSKNYPVRWLLLWQDESEVGVSFMEQARMEKPLTQTEYRVRDYLLGSIGIGNYVFVNQAEVGRELRIHRQDVYAAIKRLIQLQILLIGPKSGRSNTYSVNPAFCFAGGLGNGVKERKEAIKQGKAKILQFNPKAETQQGSLLE